MNAMTENAPVSTGTASPTLHLLQPKDYARWDAFVAATPDATFFHRAGWQTIIERTYGHKTWFYYAEQDGRIVGILPRAASAARCTACRSPSRIWRRPRACAAARTPPSSTSPAGSR